MIKNINLYNDQKYSDFFKYVDKQWISNNNFIKWNYHSVLSYLKKVIMIHIMWVKMILIELSY